MQSIFYLVGRSRSLKAFDVVKCGSLACYHGRDLPKDVVLKVQGGRNQSSPL
jgi:hypothetical protein